MITYMNQALGTRSYFKESVLPPSTDHRVVRAHLIVSASQSFFQGLMVAAEGTKTHYVYSYTPEAYRNAVTLGIWGLYAYYRVISNFTSGYFHVFSAVFHVQTCKQILQYRDKHLESLGRSLKSYRMLQILNSLFNESFSKVFIPVSMVFLAINVILGNFGTLRFFGEMEFNLYMNFPLFSLMMLIFVFTFYPNNAKVFDESLSAPTKLMMSYVRPSPTSEERDRYRIGRKQGTEEEINVTSSAVVSRNTPRVNTEVAKAWTLKEIQCIARSMPIIAVRIGSFSPIKRSTVVSFFDFLLGNTISALLTWK
ncbi:unnamed protein product [Allacma fusca]|uniref:Uncharacterized protein n=1 Tax=Allacma fusca TaxID=39272 RepID=A0A8J2JBG3_9HEXA|nr:unnamed protein product [Allacma fusca]